MSDSMIERSAARLFADTADRTVREEVEAGGWPGALWDRVAESGFPWALATEAAGGLGASWPDACAILRGIGHWQVPLPLAETMIAAHLLSGAGLPPPEGPITLLEASGDVALSGSRASPRLHGRAIRVPWARHCGWAAAVTPDGDVLLGDLRQPAHLRIEPLADVAGLPSDTVVLDGAAVLARAPAPPGALPRPVALLGAAARAAMMVGAMESVLAQTVQYANDRVQFGKPIGRYQAIQQQVALMAGEVAAARVATLVAMADLGGAATAGAVGPRRAEFGVAVAKTRAGEAAGRTAAIAHQVHGAIGFTREHSLHFATRRLWAWRDEYGTDAQWAAWLGRHAIEGRAAGFWPALTERCFA
jgi:acyl-CoA dehydrogenase